MAPIERFLASLIDHGLGDSYEAHHAHLAISALDSYRQRLALLASGEIPSLPEPTRSAADESYREAAQRICEGLENLLSSYANSEHPRDRRIFELWRTVSHGP